MFSSEAMICAASTGDIRGVEVALATGEDINVHVGIGYSPLLYASISQRMPNEEARTGMIRFLLENGADLHQGCARRSVCTKSWHRYCVEPSVKLLALRHLSLAGRAVAPPHLLRLFGAPPWATGCASRTRSKRRLGSINAPPEEVFGLILEFWGGNRP